MVEILLATMILAVGFIMLLPAFTVGLNESRITIERAVSVQVASNADALCERLLKRGDPNWSSNGGLSLIADNTVKVYGFNAAVPALSDTVVTSGGAPVSIRVLGNPAKSSYYWSLLYRVKPEQSSLVELWIMACKRTRVGVSGSTVNGMMAPQKVGISGTAGSKTLGGAIGCLDADTSIVTDTGEVLNISAVGTDGSIRLDNAVARTFSEAWVVLAGNRNVCIWAVHAKKAF